MAALHGQVFQILNLRNEAGFREVANRRGGQTYAQAAATAAELAADAAADGDRPGHSCTKLRFYVDDTELPADYTIFQAVSESQRIRRSQSGADGEHTSQMRPRRLWDDMHTLRYSRCG